MPSMTSKMSPSVDIRLGQAVNDGARGALAGTLVVNKHESRFFSSISSDGITLRSPLGAWKEDEIALIVGIHSKVNVPLVVTRCYAVGSVHVGFVSVDKHDRILVP